MHPAGTVSVKDTVLVPLPVLGEPRHVQQGQLGRPGTCRGRHPGPGRRPCASSLRWTGSWGGGAHWAPPPRPGPGPSAPLRKDRWAQVRPFAQSAPEASESTGGCEDAGESWFPCSEHSIEARGGIVDHSLDQHSPLANGANYSHQLPGGKQESGLLASLSILSDKITGWALASRQSGSLYKNHDLVAGMDTITSVFGGSDPRNGHHDVKRSLWVNGLRKYI